MKQDPKLKKRVNQGLKLRKRVKRQRRRFGFICAKSRDGLAVCDEFPARAVSDGGLLRKQWSPLDGNDFGDRIPWSKMGKFEIAFLEQTRWTPRVELPWLVQLAMCAQ